MSANAHIEELLSGFLDGELTAEELREFESAMAADGTLAVKLEQIRQLSSDLRSVPKRSLGPDFASRVLAAVQQQKLVVEQPKTNVRAQRISWRAAGALTALAASVMFALYASNWFQGPGLNSGAGQVAVVPQGDPPMIAGSQNPSETPPDTQSSGDANYVRKTPMTKTFPVLMIFEIETTLKAWDTNAIGTVLANEGIVWTDPVTASEDVIKTLNETRSINSALPTSGDDQLALVMVRASGRAIDKAMIKVSENKNDFPHLLMDIAFAMPGKELFEKITGKRAFATPITARPSSSDNWENNPFSRPSSAKRPQPLERFDSATMSEYENEITDVLLVIRKLAK